ncbi:MAG: nucleoside triphosphate pyrophosphohydrolase [Pseudomonadota bacterium]
MSKAQKTADGGIGRLLDVMRCLRDPERGCPWDLEQDFTSIAPHTIEEAYEVAQTIADGDLEALREELGDLLFQVVYHAQMAAELGRFGFEDVVGAISEKMIRRHPHVFGEDRITNAQAQVRAWETFKEAEREEKKGGEGGGRAGALEGIAHALPALLRARKLQKRAARIGFDWDSVDGVFAKLAEEIAEIKAELPPAGSDKQPDSTRLSEEVGDLLFACVNLARHLDVEPESALRAANAKFERRFGRVETLLAEVGLAVEGVSLEKLEEFWTQAKAEERKA